MASDGTMTGVYLRWYRQTNNDALTIDLMEEAKQRNMLTVVIGALFLILGVINWQYRRSRAAALPRPEGPRYRLGTIAYHR